MRRKSRPPSRRSTATACRSCFRWLKVRARRSARSTSSATRRSARARCATSCRSLHRTARPAQAKPNKTSHIKLAGNLLDREAELNKLVKIMAGDRFSAEKLQSTTKAIVDKLGEYGYDFAQVNAQPQINQADHSVDLTLNVDPSRRGYVRRVHIVGN